MTEQPITTDLHCHKCKYSLRGLVISGQCPECGFSIASSIELEHAPQSSFPVRSVAFLTVLVLPIVNFVVVRMSIGRTYDFDPIETLGAFFWIWVLATVALFLSTIVLFANGARRTSSFVFLNTLACGAIAFINAFLWVAAVASV